MENALVRAVGSDMDSEGKSSTHSFPIRQEI